MLSCCTSDVLNERQTRTKLSSVACTSLVHAIIITAATNPGPYNCVQARKNLEYVRGRKDVDKEFNDLVEAARIAAQCKNPWGTIFSKKYWPQLILSACSTTFQQWTG